MPPKELAERDKCGLLSCMLATSDECETADIPEFWNHVAATYESSGERPLPRMHGKELELLWDREEQVWFEERTVGRNRRRKGHEAGSQYDQLMEQWTTVWDAKMTEYWVWRMASHGARNRDYTLVPEKFRNRVQDEVTKRDKRASKSRSARPPKSTSEPAHFEYDGDKLKRVVEAAKKRANETGKAELAAAVNEIYQNSLTDSKLRVLLEAILTQTANATQNGEFQAYVRAAKKRLKGADAVKATTPVAASAEESSPQVQLTRDGRRGKETSSDAAPERASIVITPTPSASDSAYGSQAPNDQSVTRPSRGDSSVGSGAMSTEGPRGVLKRTHDDATSSAATEAAGGAVSERATKRSKPAPVEEAAGETPRSSPAATRKDRSSRDSSPLSEHRDTDLEVAKEAYLHEIRRRSTDTSSQTIGDHGESVSSRMVTGEDDAGRDREEARPASEYRSEQHDTDNGIAAREQDRSSKRQTSGPSQEQLTPAESMHAYDLIASAAAEAVNPRLAQLESKIEALISSQAPAARRDDGIVDNTAPSPDKELAHVTDMLKTGPAEAQGGELMQLVAQLTRNAAEASIAAAEAARRAGEVAKDVSVMLTLLGRDRDGRDQAAPRKTSSEGNRRGG